MEQGKIHIFTGDGRGKTSAAVGCAMQAACSGKETVIIQFLKGKGLEDSAYVKRLEPEIKLFRFEKAEADFNELSEEEKAEAILNIKNGINFARKVLSTGECDLLILDEVLGLIDNQIITEQELQEMLSLKQEHTTVILTGIVFNNNVCLLADQVSKIETVHFKRWDEI